MNAEGVWSDLKQSFNIFLLVVEEMSIGRAAKRAFVTQQCASDHIRRLEVEYGVTLFERKPNLHLTAAGEIMLKTLRSIRILENNMEKNLKEISTGQKGSFTVGLSTSRAQVILPLVLQSYYEHFPEVDVSFYVNDTIILEQRLLDGSIDLFLGVNASGNPAFSVLPLTNDEMYLIISESLFQMHFGSRRLTEFKQGVDLSEFSMVPFSLYFETGALNIIINRHLSDYGITLKKTPYHVSDCDTHILLCASGLCAALIPKMLSLRVHEHNEKCNPEQAIHIFPIKNFSYPLRVDLIWHTNVEQPFYVKAFCEIIRETVNKLL